MKHELGLSADTLSSTLKWLIAQGWIAKNPGYGHPLRPEYILTAEGATIANAAQQFAEVSHPWGDIVYLRWSVPRLVAVQRGAGRFNEIQSTLGKVSPRALTQGLRNLSSHNLVLRSVEDSYPPRSGYALTDAGQSIAIAGEPLL